MEDESILEEEQTEKGGVGRPSSNPVSSSKKPSLEKTGTKSDTLTPSSSLEAPSVRMTVGHSASLKSQTSGENGYSTPTGGRRVGSFRRVHSGGSKTNPKLGAQSRQGSNASLRKGSEGVLRVGSGGSVDAHRSKGSVSLFRTVSTGYETDDEGNVYYSTSRPGWGFDQIAMQSDSDSDLEFFDAKG